MKKKGLLLLVAALLLFPFSGCSGAFLPDEPPKEAFARAEIRMTIDGRPAAPGKPLALADGCVMAPLREFAALAGADADWNPETNAVTLRRGSFYAEFTIGSRTYVYGTDQGEPVEAALETAPLVIDSAAYAPLRAVAEALGFSVAWEEETRTAHLASVDTEARPAEAGYAGTPALFWAEAGKYVEDTVPAFTVAGENLPSDIWETDIREYFDNVETFQCTATIVGDKISVAYQADYYMHAKILHAHRSGDLSGLGEQDKAAYEIALRVVAEHTSPDMTDFEKETALHDYIVLNTRYAEKTTPQGDYPKEAHTPYGALAVGEAVCEGYSTAFKLLLELAGVECELVSGTAKGENHSWNRVRLDGEYYLTDPTWNDPTPDRPGVVLYDYFNLTDEMMNREHTPARPSEKKADSTAYNYYYYNGLLVENQQDFEAIVKQSVMDGAQTVSVMGRTLDVAALDLDRIFLYYPRSFRYTTNDSLNILHIFFE